MEYLEYLVRKLKFTSQLGESARRAIAPLALSPASCAESVFFGVELKMHPGGLRMNRPRLRSRILRHPEERGEQANKLFDF